MPLDFPSGATVGTIYTGTNGAVYAYDGTKWRISSQTTSTYQDIIPAANLTYDLGSTSSQWRSLYVGTSTIYLGGTALSVSGGNITVDGSPVSGAANLGQFKISGNNLGTVDNPNTGGWGGYDMYIDPGFNSDAFIYIPGVPNQAASTNLQISNNSTAGAIQLFGRGGVQVVVNHGVNEKVFEFADDGSLIFPNSTIQSSAWTGSTSTLVRGTYTVQLLVDGNLTLPGEIHGKQLYGIGGTPNGRAVNITPASNASDKKFGFRVDQYGETFTRAYLDMPTAQNNKQVAISFAHQNNTVGYIFNQGADTFDDGLNNAFNIFYNAGDIKLTAMTTGTGVFRTWKFGQSGGLTSPDGTTSTGASVHVPYATSSSYKITTEIDMLGSYMPLTFEVIGDTIKLPTGNGRIQSGNFLNAWSLDSLNKSFTFPNNSDIEYGEGTYLSTGSLRVRVDFGGEFKIFLSQPNKTWTFDNSGNIVFPDGTTQTTAFVSGSIGGYTPSTVGNWGTPTVTTISAALDELAQRTTTVESIAGVTGTNVTNVFMYNSNASFSMTQNVEYKIPFDTATTGNDAGDFQTTSSQFIPQIAGWYLLETHLNFGGVWSGNVNVSVYKNNNQEKLIGSSWIGNGGGVGGSAMVYCNGTTDIVEIRATQTSGGVQALEHGATKTWFQATWMKS